MHGEQTEDKTNRDAPTTLRDLIDALAQVTREYSVDADRIYQAGVSTGDGQGSSSRLKRPFDSLPGVSL